MGLKFKDNMWTLEKSELIEKIEQKEKEIKDLEEILKKIKQTANGYVRIEQPCRSKQTKKKQELKD